MLEGEYIHFEVHAVLNPSAFDPLLGNFSVLKVAYSKTVLLSTTNSIRMEKEI